MAERAIGRHAELHRKGGHAGATNPACPLCNPPRPEAEAPPVADLDVDLTCGCTVVGPGWIACGWHQERLDEAIRQAVQTALHFDRLRAAASPAAPAEAGEAEPR